MFHMRVSWLLHFMKTKCVILDVMYFFDFLYFDEMNNLRIHKMMSRQKSTFSTPITLFFQKNKSVEVGDEKFQKKMLFEKNQF
jgi:hypothetical protein